MKGVSQVQSIPVIICPAFRTIRVIWQQFFPLAEEKADHTDGNEGKLSSIYSRLRSLAMYNKKFFVL